MLSFEPHKHYLLHGNESYLIYDSAQSLESQAKKQGFDVLHLNIEPGSAPWQAFILELTTADLFSSQCLISCDVPIRLKNADIHLIIDALGKSPEDKQVLFKTEQPILPKHKQMLLPHVSFIPHWRQNKAEFHRWLHRKVQEKQLNINQDALDWLCEQHQGNPLGAVNTCENLALVFGQEPITYQALQNTLMVKGQYEVFDFATAVIERDGKKITQIAEHLCAASISLQLVMWSLRQSFYALHQLAMGHEPQATWRKFQIRPQYTRRFEASLQHYPLSRCKQAIAELSYLDRRLKNTDARSGWQLLFSYVMDY